VVADPAASSVAPPPKPPTAVVSDTLLPISGATPSSSRRREAERRQVTVVLFAFDLVSNPDTPADPERQRDLARVLRRWCQEFTAEHGGAMLPDTGQEPAACFGFPIAHEDAAPRAARAAMQVVQEAAWNARPGGLAAGITVAAVVHTGDVVAELGTTDQPDAVVLTGDALPVAARLAAQAEPGAVTVTAPTRKLLQAFFDTEPLGSLRV